MKSQESPFHRSASLAVSLSLGLCATSASAGILYWDGNGTGATGNPPTAGAGGGGTWEPAADATPNWWNGSAYQTWNGTGGLDIADFRGASTYTVALAGNITANKLNFGTGNAVTLSGNTIDLGSSGVIDFNGTTSHQITSLLKGAITINATGSTIGFASAAAGTFNGDNTQLTSTVLNLNADTNHIVLNHAGALGAAGADVKLTKGILNLGNVAAASTSYNAWDLELNGGAIRARFGLQTINGPVTLTANSTLMTRDANDAGQDPKLVFSSTATIALGGNTLFLHSALRPDNAGIELNGVISGTGGLTQQTSALAGAGTATGVTTLTAVNTYTGNTLVNNGTLALSSSGGLKFIIGADDVNNLITGTGPGSVILDGLFTFDLAGASTTIGDSWNIVDIANLNESFGSNFAVFGFTPDGGGILWNGSANGASYQFSEGTGVLTVVPEPRAALLGGIGLLALLRRRR
jgi:autotransporter-associated beta strand protein